MKKPYMCLVCGNMFATSQESKQCDHKKPAKKKRATASKVVNEKDL